MIDIKKLEPFGTGNPVPTFLLRGLKIIKPMVLNKKHISCNSKIKNMDFRLSQYRLIL